MYCRKYSCQRLYAKALNQKWAKDVTEFKWYEGSRYINFISVLSWISMNVMYYLNRFYVENTLRKAISQYIDFYNNVRMREHFGNRIPAQVRNEAMKSDVIAQYSIALNKRIEKYKFRYTE